MAGLATCAAAAISCFEFGVPRVEGPPAGDSDERGPPTVTWSYGFGDENHQYLTDLAVDDEGVVIMAGSFYGASTLPSGELIASGRDFYLAKLDASGSFVWIKQYGDDNDQSHLAVGCAGNDTIIAGNFAETMSFGGAEVTTPAGTSDGFSDGFVV